MTHLVIVCFLGKHFHLGASDLANELLCNDFSCFVTVSAPPSPASRPVMATMAALAGMSGVAVAAAPRLGVNHQQQRNRSALHSRDNVPMRVVRNSVSWDDVKPSNARFKQLQHNSSMASET